MKTTYGQLVCGENKTNTNKKVIEEANAIIKNEGSNKEIVLISEFYEQQKLKLLIDILQKRASDVTSQMVINDSNLHLIEHGRKKVRQTKI